MPTRKQQTYKSKSIDIDDVNLHLNEPNKPVDMTKDNDEDNDDTDDDFILKFRVDYKPTPLKRPRLTRIGGRPVIYDASKKEKKDWLNLAMKYSPSKPFPGPLRMFLEFYFPRPKNHYRTGKYSDQIKPNAPHIHTSMPDIDNLSKFILDAMNEIFYEDDRQVVELNSHKEYCNDVTNKRGYTIITIVPYKKKSSLFTTNAEYSKSSNKTIYNALHIQDSSDSISI